MSNLQATPSAILRDLGGGLILRRATPADAEPLAAFNALIHGEPPEPKPDQRIAAWTRDLLSNRHPTVKADDTLIVEDTHTGAIVSSTNLISQRWTYDGIEFGVGRPELVGTHADYRRRGLIRAQFEVLHQWSLERGEMAQGITGIPWYYRQFGYEMGLALGGGRSGFRPQVPELKAGETEPYRLEPATEADLPFITALYAQYSRRSLVGCVRDQTLWRHELHGHSEFSIQRRELRLIVTAPGKPVGFLAHSPALRGNMLAAYTYELEAGLSWLAVTPSVIRYLVATGDAYAARDGQKACEMYAFGMGVAHPVYEAMADRLPRVRPPYAWYVRVPDLPRFLQHITPVLERRLAESVAAGHTGKLKLSFYKAGVRLVFEAGRITGIEPWEPSRDVQGDAVFPDLTFLQILFGYRTLDELKYAFKDCGTDHNEADVLLNALFPKRASHFWEVG
jgi:hypothetical protein